MYKIPNNKVESIEPLKFSDLGMHSNICICAAQRKWKSLSQIRQELVPRKHPIKLDNGFTCKVQNVK